MIGLQGSTIWHEGQGTYSAIDFISTPGAKSNAGDLTLQPLLSISSRLHTGPDSVPRSSMGWLHSLSPLSGGCGFGRIPNVETVSSLPIIYDPSDETFIQNHI
jgi:hypothetical protein